MCGGEGGGACPHSKEIAFTDMIVHALYYDYVTEHRLEIWKRNMIVEFYVRIATANNYNNVVILLVQINTNWQ